MNENRDNRKYEIKKFVASNIFILGLVSMFTDIGTYMVYPLLPLYLVTAFGSSPAIIGIIEGIAESLASVLKVFSGNIADKRKNKKALAGAGYSASFIYKIIILLSTSWIGVLFARIVEKIGKGLRVAPRDMLVAEAAKRENLGKAYGIHKSMDMLGAAIGILIAYFIMLNSGKFTTVFILSLIPALIAPLLLFFIKKTPSEVNVKKSEFRWKTLDTRLKLFLVVNFIFTLGNSSNAFLILRASGAGFSNTASILLFFVYNLSASLLAFPMGKLSDKIGKRTTLFAGYFIYGVVYLAIGLVSNHTAYWFIFALYGVYTALIAGCERALISEIAPAEIRGGALGLQSAVAGFALLPASIIAGLLWEVGQSAPFIFGGALGFLASFAMLFVLNSKRSIKDDLSLN